MTQATITRIPHALQTSFALQNKTSVPPLRLPVSLLVSALGLLHLLLQSLCESFYQFTYCMHFWMCRKTLYSSYVYCSLQSLLQKCCVRGRGWIASRCMSGIAFSFMLQLGQDAVSAHQTCSSLKQSGHESSPSSIYRCMEEQTVCCGLLKYKKFPTFPSFFQQSAGELFYLYI